jgi:hypothetical protein
MSRRYRVSHNRLDACPVLTSKRIYERPRKPRPTLRAFSFLKADCLVSVLNPPSSPRPAAGCCQSKTTSRPDRQCRGETLGPLRCPLPRSRPHLDVDDPPNEQHERGQDPAQAQPVAGAGGIRGGAADGRGQVGDDVGEDEERRAAAQLELAQAVRDVHLDHGARGQDEDRRRKETRVEGVGVALEEQDLGHRLKRGAPRRSWEQSFRQE